MNQVGETRQAGITGSSRLRAYSVRCSGSGPLARTGPGSAPTKPRRQAVVARRQPARLAGANDSEAPGPVAAARRRDGLPSRAVARQENGIRSGAAPGNSSSPRAGPRSRRTAIRGGRDSLPAAVSGWGAGAHRTGRIPHLGLQRMISPRVSVRSTVSVKLLSETWRARKRSSTQPNEGAAALEGRFVELERDLDAAPEAQRTRHRQPADHRHAAHRAQAIDMAEHPSSAVRACNASSSRKAAALLGAAVEQRQVVKRELADELPAGRVLPQRLAWRRGTLTQWMLSTGAATSSVKSPPAAPAPSIAAGRGWYRARAARAGGVSGWGLVRIHQRKSRAAHIGARAKGTRLAVALQLASRRRVK